ncbi:MAG: alpha/beta hydrolase-fold protein [Verrucomicrobia bacterium]|nr:alpha/beta hydrolase-fold protein [Verrucomicrobiota bacterium]
MNAAEFAGKWSKIGLARLANAHAKLDATVFAAYDWPADLTDDAAFGKAAGAEFAGGRSGTTLKPMEASRQKPFPAFRSRRAVIHWLVAVLTAAIACPVSGAEKSRQTSASRPWNTAKGPASPDVKHHSFASKVVNAEVGYNVWLPPGYDDGTARYPVLYFLPGNGGNEYDGTSAVLQRVRAAVKKKTLPPVICVFCNPGNGTFRDNRVPGVLGETMFMTEFVPTIDREFRTVASRKGRVVTGFSMGGSGALRFVLGHPRMFAAGVSWGCPRLKEEEAAMSRLGQAKEAGTAVMIVFGTKESEKSLGVAENFVKTLSSHGVPSLLKRPEVPHSLELYLNASWDDVAAFLNTRLKPSSQ